MTQYRNRGFQQLVNRLRKRVNTGVEQVQEKLDSPAVDLLPRTRVVQWILWSMIGGCTIGFAWSLLARIDVVVAARGKLEPESSSQPVQSRAGGVVTAVLVQEGQAVEEGQLLMQLDKTQLLNQLEGLSRQRAPLVQKIAVLRVVRQGQSPQVLQSIALPPELASRIQDRGLLVAQLTGNPAGLDALEQQRYDLFQQQVRDRQAVNTLQARALATQQVGTTSDITTTTAQLRAQQAQLSRLTALVRAGGISQADYMNRVAQVNALQNQLTQQRVQQQQTTLDWMQSGVEGRQSVRDLYQQTQAELAQLDRDIDASVEQDVKQVEQIDSQMEQLKTDLATQDLRAPVDGWVLSLEAKIPGAVTQPGQPIMQVTPDEALTVRLQVANADIANLRPGLPVDIRVDAYPITEFGSLQGSVTQVGSDAVASENASQPSFFPVEVQIDPLSLQPQGDGKELTLTPGMTVTGNVKTGQRSPISFVAEQILRAIDELKAS